MRIKLYRKLKNGKREEIVEHELLDLLDAPNAAHTGEQLRHLHFTYMNYVGESYRYMRDLGGNPYEPKKKKLPAAMEIFPSHQVQFTLGDNGRSYSQSTVRYGGERPRRCGRESNEDALDPREIVPLRGVGPV